MGVGVSEGCARWRSMEVLAGRCAVCDVSSGCQV